MKSDYDTAGSRTDHSSRRHSWAYRLWWNHLPSCQQTIALVSQHLDQTLPWTQRLPLYFHLIGCKYCRRYYQHSKFLREGLQLLASAEKIEMVSAPLNLSARERMARNLKNRLKV